MSSPRFRRRIALLAVAALLFGSTAFLAHHDGEDAFPQKASHCELCSHFHGTAGSPTAAIVAGKPVLVVRQAVTLSQAVRPFERNVDSRLPRGPPFIDLI